MGLHAGGAGGPHTADRGPPLRPGVRPGRVAIFGQPPLCTALNRPDNSSCRADSGAILRWQHQFDHSYARSAPVAAQGDDRSRTQDAPTPPPPWGKAVPGLTRGCRFRPHQHLLGAGTAPRRRLPRGLRGRHDRQPDRAERRVRPPGRHRRSGAAARWGRQRRARRAAQPFLAGRLHGVRAGAASWTAAMQAGSASGTPPVRHGRPVRPRVRSTATSPSARTWATTSTAAP